MQVSKYLYKHFAQLNCHNLNYGVKITSAVLLQYVKALGFKVLTLKFYGKPKRNNFSITVKHNNYNNCYCLNWRTNKNGYIVFVGFVLFKKLITCKIAGYFFLPVFSQKKIPPFAGGKIIIY